MADLEYTGLDFLTDDEEENIDPKKLHEENTSLQRKLRLKNKEILKQQENIKVLQDKLDSYSQKLASNNEEHNKKIEALKESTDFKLQENMKLCSSLKMYIDEQEDKMQEVLVSKGEDVLFNVSNSVRMFVKQIAELQNQLIKFQEENSEMKSLCQKKDSDICQLKEKINSEYVPKFNYDLLIKEKQILARTQLTPLKESKSFSNVKIDLLSEQISSAQKRSDDLVKENCTLKRKLRGLESKCTTLMFSPAKFQTREKKDDGMEMRLDEAENEKFQLKIKMKELELKHQCEIKESKEQIEAMEKKLKASEEQDTSGAVESEIIAKELKEIQEKYKLERLKNSKLNEKISLLEMVEAKTEELVLDMDSIVEKRLELRYQHQATSMQSRLQKFSCLVNSLKSVPSVLRELQEYKNQIDRDLRMFVESVTSSLDVFKSQVISSVDDTSKRASILSIRYKKEMDLRKRLHNELVELKGNIRVFCRVRPVIKEDGAECEQVISFGGASDMDGDVDNELYVGNNKNSNARGAAGSHSSNKKRFEMDRVFQPSHSQEKVFEDIEPLVTSCLDGYNVCIFAYGQTGSGKTFTMEGTKEDPGVNQRSLMHLFEKTTNELVDWNFTISVSFVEIYNESLLDLLRADLTDAPKLEIKQIGHHSGNNNQQQQHHHVPGLTHVEVKNVDDINAVFNLGRLNRSTACTSMNERSSRSHSVLAVNVVGENRNTKTQVKGKLNLVDLAGSERVSKSGSHGQRMKEAQSINKSLSALGDVIHALKNKSKHVPYRNTKLTYLLQDSLGGDSKTLMMVQVSPVDKNANETVCSLNFAQRVREVELGTATANRERRL